LAAKSPETVLHQQLQNQIRIEPIIFLLPRRRRSNRGGMLTSTGNVKYWHEHFRFPVPVQTVDATPSNALIRERFPGRTLLFGRTQSKPSQGSVPLT
jgi:hypothetical protein